MDKKMRVLLVDDSHLLSDLFQIQLQHLGAHSLEVRRTKKEALAAFQSQEFDVVFIDMRLEGQEERGLDILRDIKALKPEQSVVILSVNDQAGVIKSSKAAGASFYMIKPFTLDGLRLVLSGDEEGVSRYQPCVGEGRIFPLQKRLIRRLRNK